MNRRELMTTAASIVPAVTFRNEWGPEYGNGVEQKRLGSVLVMISPVEIVQAFAGPYHVIAARFGDGNKLPADIVVRGVSYDFQRDMFLVRVESPSLPVTPLGQELPVWEPIEHVKYEAVVRHADGTYRPMPPMPPTSTEWKPNVR